MSTTRASPPLSTTGKHEPSRTGLASGSRMPARRLGMRRGEQRIHVLRFTRADVVVARRLGLRDHDGWRTRRCSMRELALRPCTHCSPPLPSLVCALGMLRSGFFRILTVKMAYSPRRIYISSYKLCVPIECASEGAVAWTSLHRGAPQPGAAMSICLAWISGPVTWTLAGVRCSVARWRPHARPARAD